LEPPDPQPPFQTLKMEAVGSLHLDKCSGIVLVEMEVYPTLKVQTSDGVAVCLLSWLGSECLVALVPGDLGRICEDNAATDRVLPRSPTFTATFVSVVLNPKISALAKIAFTHHFGLPKITTSNGVSGRWRDESGQFFN